jgi:uncharacterized cupredoxin-like copper-binding protein
MNWHAKHLLVWAFGLLVWLGGLLNPVFATSLIADLVRQPVVEMVVSLGTADNALRFVPDRLDFEAGKRYKLVLTNPSAQKHYFTAKDFADSIWTQKVEAGKVEVKGTIHELELKPGATAEWVFIPIKTGAYSLHCSIPGHTEAGMVGTVAIATNSKA